MKKITCLLTICAVFLLNTTGVFAMPNYQYTTVTEEHYSASSPVGHFNNGDNRYQNYQNIQVPQNYHKTVTSSTSYIDTRDNADKIIDRSMKVVGVLALAGITTGIILGATNNHHHR